MKRRKRGKRGKRGRRDRRDRSKTKPRQLSYIKELFVRLFLTLVLPIKNLALFYAVFTPLTIYLTYFLLTLFYAARLEGSVVYLENYKYAVEFIKPCVAGAAYYFLALLNLLTKGIKPFDRLKIFLFTSVTLLVVNVIRIMILIAVLIGYGKVSFSAIHIGFWTLGSTVFVVAIWIAAVKFFKIKEIPIYSDFRELRDISRE